MFVMKSVFFNHLSLIGALSPSPYTFLHGRMQGVGKQAFSPLEIGAKQHRFLENLNSET